MLIIFFDENFRKKRHDRRRLNRALISKGLRFEMMLIEDLVTGVTNCRNNPQSIY